MDGVRRRSRMRILLPVLPALVIGLFFAPVASGFLGTVAPAFGYLPALGGKTWSLDAFATLFAEPGLWTSLFMSLTTGLAASFLSFAMVMLFLAAFAETPHFIRVQRLLSPLLSVPHASVAFGLAFLIAPSGLIARILSPWATGWLRPADLQIVNDPYGLSLILGLVVKEVPFLFLMGLAALPQIPVRQSRQVMAALGYGRILGFLLSAGPSLYRQLRLPILAVLAFSISVADVAMILGPQLPPTLAVRITQWMADPDLQKRFVGSAGALAQMTVFGLAVLIWGLGEKLAHWRLQALATAGSRYRHDKTLSIAASVSIFLSVFLVIGSVLGLLLWSVSGLWPFPYLFPTTLNFETWMRNLPLLASPVATTLAIAAGASSLSLILTVLLLWVQSLSHSGSMSALIAKLIYLPLVIPQLAFVFGLQVLFLSAGFQPQILTLTAVHMIFVLPYVYLSLQDPWDALDPRYDRLSYGFGKSKLKTLLSIRLPLLIRPLATAFAVGLAVSIGLYLPTVLIGAGRITTITTEAVALSSGGDRRVIGVYALVQTLLPFAGFLIASILPALLEPRRSHQESRFERP